MTFLLGILASLMAGCILWMATHPAECRYFLRSRGRNRDLTGRWHQYHLSIDPDAGGRPIWIHHEEVIRISSWGRVRGSSVSLYEKRLEYSITGYIRGRVMRLWFQNENTEEDMALVVYPNLIHRGILIGMWVGEDFDKNWCSGPILLSRDELPSDDEKAQLARRLHIISPPVRRRSARDSRVEAQKRTG